MSALDAEDEHGGDMEVDQARRSIRMKLVMEKVLDSLQESVGVCAFPSWARRLWRQPSLRGRDARCRSRTPRQHLGISATSDQRCDAACFGPRKTAQPSAQHRHSTGGGKCRLVPSTNCTADGRRHRGLSARELACAAVPPPTAHLSSSDTPSHRRSFRRRCRIMT